MRFAIVLAAGLVLVGCNQDKVDMAAVKSPDAGVMVPNKAISSKPKTSPYKVQKISDGLNDQTKTQ